MKDRPVNTGSFISSRRNFNYENNIGQRELSSPLVEEYDFNQMTPERSKSQMA